MYFIILLRNDGYLKKIYKMFCNDYFNDGLMWMNIKLFYGKIKKIIGLC